MVAQPDPADIQALRSYLTRDVPELPVRWLGDAVPEGPPPRAEGPNRVEETLLDRHASIVLALSNPREIARVGPGATRKLRPLLEGAPTLRRCAVLAANATRVQAVCRRVSADFPRLDVRGVVGDYHRDVGRLGPGGQRLLVVLSRAFGGLRPGEVGPFLEQAAALMERNDTLLLGVDLDPGAPTPAKDLARFHRSMLGMVNHRYGADFDAEAFEHVSDWDPGNAWVDHRLRARRRMRVSIPTAELVLDLAPGQEIRTDLRCRYTRPRLRRLVEATRLQVFAWLTDEDETSALVMLRRK